MSDRTENSWKGDLFGDSDVKDSFSSSSPFTPIRRYSPPITSEERIKLKDLLDKKEKKNKIAKILNWNTSRVFYEIRRGGGDKNYDPYKAEKLYSTSPFLRTFSDEEAALIIKMRGEGCGVARIRNQLKCGAVRLNRFLEEKGVSNPRMKDLCIVTQRLNALEQHINIIYEILEEKNGNKKN